MMDGWEATPSFSSSSWSQRPALGGFLAGLPMAPSLLSMAFDIEKIGKLGDIFSLVENEMG
jgi:hypothetical protein